jgi:hypothetical protein
MLLSLLSLEHWHDSAQLQAASVLHEVQAILSLLQVLQAHDMGALSLAYVESAGRRCISCGEHQA